MTHFQSLSAAGFAATAISYGPGRVGFGLFVPAFSGAFSLDGTTIGLISSLGFGGFFLALLTAQYLLNRQGPEVPVLVFVGSEDGFVAPDVGRAAAAMTSGRLVEFEGCGHAPFLEEGERYRHELGNFLTTLG